MELYRGTAITFIIGIAILTMELVVPNPDVRPRCPIAELNMTYAALEAFQMVIQPQTLDYHSSTATYEEKKKRIESIVNNRDLKGSRKFYLILLYNENIVFCR